MAYGYKVVRDDGEGHLQSAMRLGKVLHYQRGKPTIPRSGDGPLAVFDNLFWARDFQEVHYSLRVFRCRFRTSRETSIWAKGKGTRYLIELPSGTRCADSVTLLYEVQ